MTTKDIQLLFAYNRWANAQTLDAASRLTAEQLMKDLASSYKSVHSTLTHILGAEWIWLMRSKGISPKALLDPKDFPSLAALREKWLEVEQEQQKLIAEMTDESIESVVAYTNAKGEQWAYPLQQILQHVVNHSSYHRGQVMGMLRQLGAEAVPTDFLVYIDLESEGA